MEAGSIGKIAVIGVAMLAAPIAYGDEDDTWALDRAGFYIGSFTNDLRLHGSVNGTIDAQGTLLDGTDIDFDKEFDFGGRHSVLELGASWRPFDRHQISFDYHRDSRSGSRSLQRDVVYAGETFPVDARVDARFRAQVYDLRYTYYPWITLEDAIGVSVGVVDYRVDLKLRAQGAISGMSETRTISAAADSHLPAPLVGLNYHHAFSPQWRFIVDAAYFKARIHKIDGDVTDVHAGFEYFPVEHIGLAAVYSAYRIDADISRHALDGHLDLRSRGFQLLLRVR
jgi:hypothetical protein